MAETKNPVLEREYIVPLRKEWRKVAYYRRAGRAAKFIKAFIARHMKVPDHDPTKVKLDIYLNNEIWFRGKKKPPARIKVIAKKEGEIVRVELAELPDIAKYAKARHEKLHKASDSPVEKPEPTEAKEEKTPEEKKDEKEKETSAAIQKEKIAETQAKTQKHTIKAKEPQIHRKALKK